MTEIYEKAASPNSPSALVGMSAALLALVEALDRKGILTFEEYRKVLGATSDEMPPEDQTSEAGRTVDGILSLVTDAIMKKRQQRPNV